MATQYKTLIGEPTHQQRYDDSQPYGLYDGGIEAQLERAAEEGWRLVHTASFAAVSTNEHQRPRFYCLVSREGGGVEK